MTSDVTASNDLPIPAAAPSPSELGRAWPFAVVAALVALADWLFFRHTPGISILLFLTALLAGFAAVNWHQLRMQALLRAGGVFLLCVLPLVVELSFPALVFAVLGTAYFIRATTQESATWKVRAADILALLFQCAWRIVPDLLSMGEKWATNARVTKGFGAIAVWLVPIVLGAIFLALFVNANPLIEHLFVRIDLQTLLAYISIPRILFWLLVSAVVWPFVFFVRRNILAKAAQSVAQSVARVIANEVGPVSVPDTVFGQAAILRSLIVFNALFAIQTILDALYLWSGVTLPAGMSYASYAHRGAYPLIVTVILAAAFVIAAMKPGSATEKSPLIRTLVFIWVGQNVLLVGSTLLRLDLYVDSYSLTYLRLAAGIWMGLVAVGLALIVVRMVLGQSNAWLVRMNLASLALVLYVCCFFNFPLIIADYNIAHSRDLAGNGPPLDWGYLRKLGPQAIPAIDSYMDRRWGEFVSGNARLTGEIWSTAKSWRRNEAEKHLLRMQDWRSWTHRDSQLAAYLKRNPNGDVGR